MVCFKSLSRVLQLNVGSTYGSDFLHHFACAVSVLPSHGRVGATKMGSYFSSALAVAHVKASAAAVEPASRVACEASVYQVL